MIGVPDGDRDRVVIDGLAFDNVTMEEAIRAVEDHIARRREMLVVTTNVDNLLRLGRDEEFRHCYASADMVLADGMPLLWVARLQGTPLKDRVSGADFVTEYCRVAARDGRRVFFLGGLDGVAQRAADILQKQFPGLVIAGSHCPSLGFDQNEDENHKIVEMVRRGRPDIVFVAAGAPKQEKWLTRYRSEFGPVVCMGVGAAFDFVSGRRRRAPRFMRNHGLEWLWRLLHEPRRLFRRYIVEDFPFFLRLVLRVIARRLKGAGAPAAPARDSVRQKPDSRQGLP
jgi:N-acetylglucosaminyldiphosphoundecaprenol N-acetyl-beta-D-mannosaminyltransferase